MIHLALWEWLVRLGVAILLGTLVGAERERGILGEHVAGMRTLALVALGAALFMLVSAYGFTAFTGAGYASVDPSRIAAQVVTGISFLGAGTILLRRNLVRGLTTAATVWVVAAIGLACGLGLLVEAAVATLLGLFVLAVLRPLERRLFPRARLQRVHLRLTRDTDPAQMLSVIHDTFRRNATHLDAIDLAVGPHGDELVLRCHGHDPHAVVRSIAALRILPGIQSIDAELPGITGDWAHSERPE
jgi:putative Mg2+ transporter-C (MgtC) family protein